jgi:hypothetical protein
MSCSFKGLAVWIAIGSLGAAARDATIRQAGALGAANHPESEHLHPAGEAPGRGGGRVRRPSEGKPPTPHKGLERGGPAGEPADDPPVDDRTPPPAPPDESETAIA